MELMTDQELLTIPCGSSWVFDVECYPNYFLVAFKHVATGKVVAFEQSDWSVINIEKLNWMLFNFQLVSFNGIKYDLVVICLLILKGFNCGQLHQATQEIIVGELRPYQMEKKYGFNVPKLNHIDLIEVAPLQASLKTYGGRLHCQKMQDLPIEPNTILTYEQSCGIGLYCVNDLDNTILMLSQLEDQLKLRHELTAKYGQDLRSKSDAQIAEAVIISEYKKITGKVPFKNKVAEGDSFKYIPPEYMSFQTEYMQQKFNQLCQMDFVIDNNGKVVLEDLKGFTITIGETDYTMGKGGLHSKEKSVKYVATATRKIVDRDVESYYPRLILNSNLYPQNMGRHFLDIFDTLVEARLYAKRTGNTSDSDSLKIVINGTFGKLGNKWSVMYAPHLLIQVTLSGQLALLMFIETLELNGIKVVSANTDGVVSLVETHQEQLFADIVRWWEGVTSLKTEETLYSALYSRDINNYIAVKTDGKVKLKGAYSNPWSDKKTAIFRFHKNPQTTICIEAIVDLITKQIPIEKTIRECTDVTKFISIKNVKGGGNYSEGFRNEKKLTYLGKVVRWYYAKGCELSTINYVGSGNKVGKSEGSKPLMDLPNSLPSDIKYEWYIDETKKMLLDIGYLTAPKLRNLF